MHQSLIRSSRESSITRNFLRQSSSSSSQSEISEISHNFYSDQSYSSENSYDDSSFSSFSSSSKNSYIRHLKKKSNFRQLFQFRFSKFYQSLELSKQFYTRSTEYSLLVSSRSFVLLSSLVSSRSLSHEYSSFVSSRSFVSSLSSVNQSIRTLDYDRELVNLITLYTDKAKYSEENDNFSFKLITFNDMCDRVDDSFEAKLKPLLIMFKRLALNYYYSNVINKKASLTFNNVCVSIISYFEDAEYKRSILNK